MKQRAKKHNASQLGFTLIELMIVVAIIGILSGIAVPSFLTPIRRDRIRMAGDGIAAFLQEASVETKKTRRTHSVLFQKSGATLHQSDDCSGTIRSRLIFDGPNAAVIVDGGSALGVTGIPSPAAGWGLYGGTASVGSGWRVGNRNCTVFPSLPGAFGNTLEAGGVLIRYQDNDNYGAWVFKMPDYNRLRVYIKEGESWTLR